MFYDAQGVSVCGGYAGCAADGRLPSGPGAADYGAAGEQDPGEPGVRDEMRECVARLFYACVVCDVMNGERESEAVRFGCATADTCMIQRVGGFIA